MNRALIGAGLLLGLVAHETPASATPCAVCDQTTACSDGTEICLGGLPETTSGRCTARCPNTGAPFGGCPTNFTCVPLTSGERVCVPRSDDCTNLTGWTEVPFGQTCTSQSCASPYICAGFCTEECTGFPNQGSCPSPYVCGRYGTAANPVFFCGTEVSEGDTCQAGSACTIGLCLRSTMGGNATCFRDCAGNPGACSASQTCMSVMLTSGDTINVCNPPQMGGGTDGGVPPPRDSGVTPPRDSGFPPPRDTGVRTDLGFEEPDLGFEEDGGVTPPRDSGFPPPRDTGVGPGVDTGTGPGADTGGVAPGGDTGPGVDTGVRPVFPDAMTSTSTGRRGGGAPAARTGGCGCAAASSPLDAFGEVSLLAFGLVFMMRRRRSPR